MNGQHNKKEGILFRHLLSSERFPRTDYSGTNALFRRIMHEPAKRIGSANIRPLNPS